MLPTSRIISFGNCRSWWIIWRSEIEQSAWRCSIGAYRFVFPQEFKHLLTETDRVLYQAKKNGRACFVIEDATEK